MEQVFEVAPGGTMWIITPAYEGLHHELPDARGGDALHSTDGGQTYASEDGGITSQMITDLDFVSKDLGYATTISALNVCNLLKFTA